MIALIIVILVILSGSAFCSGAEAAILSISPIKVRQLAQSKKPAALALANIHAHITRPIATIVMLNNMFNVGGSIIFGSLAIKVLDAKWLGPVSGILTLLIIIFGEIMPKTIGQRYAEPISLLVAIPVKLLTFILTPIIWLVEQATSPLVKGNTLPTTDEAEIKFLANIGLQEGVIEDDEAEMIQRVFQLNDLNASDLMSPRIIVTYLKGEQTLNECQGEIIKSQHTRILVINETIDDVTGLVLKDELLTAMIEGYGDRQINTLQRPAHFVPETNRADKLLKVFQDNREHLAVVLDEYGGVAGVVTLEDVLEVLTGEIVDETDRNVDLQAIARKKRLRLLKSRGINQDSFES